METKLYAYGRYVTDKASFGFDETGARIGETPNIWMDAVTPELASVLAAAPELLDALKGMKRIHGNCGASPFEQEICAKMDAAIAKAQGL